MITCLLHYSTNMNETWVMCNSHFTESLNTFRCQKYIYWYASCKPEGTSNYIRNVTYDHFLTIRWIEFTFTSNHSFFIWNYQMKRNRRIEKTPKTKFFFLLSHLKNIKFRPEKFNWCYHVHLFNNYAWHAFQTLWDVHWKSM